MKISDGRNQNINEITAGTHASSGKPESGSAGQRLADGRKRVSVLVTLILALGSVGGLYFSRSVSAAIRVWDGGGVTNKWSEAANWSDDTVPNLNDVVAFDGTSTKNVTIDAAGPQGPNINIGILQIKAGYSGTITQAPEVNLRLTVDFNQNEPLSTFTGGNGDLDVDLSARLTERTRFHPALSASTRTQAALNPVGALTPEQVTTRGNRQALQNLLTQALAALQTGDLVEARSKLTQAIERTDGWVLRGSPDGNGSGRDWVTDCAAQATLYKNLTAALDALWQ